jgi:phosphonate transport system substrate-binding protein
VAPKITLKSDKSTTLWMEARKLLSFLSLFKFIMVLYRFWLLMLLGLLLGCNQSKPATEGRLNKLTIGIVAYGEESRSLDQYQEFVDYLGKRTKALIELEPAYNEIKAVEQIQRQAWSIVFANPGLAAIAVSKAQYKPLFPLQGVDNLSSVLVVLKDSPVETLSDLNNKSIALGERGSATGYYVPLYSLYGTILSEVRIAPTPKTVLELVAKEEVTAGALSKDEFERHKSVFLPAEFRILYSSRRIPSGSVLISPKVDANQQQVIQQAMNEALPRLAQSVGYVPNSQPPDYKTLIMFIDKVKPIEARIREKPAPLYQPRE